jgi:hypothetical protein
MYTLSCVRINDIARNIADLSEYVNKKKKFLVFFTALETWIADFRENYEPQVK